MPVRQHESMQKVRDLNVGVSLRRRGTARNMIHRCYFKNEAVITDKRHRVLTFHGVVDGCDMVIGLGDVEGRHIFPLWALIKHDTLGRSLHTIRLSFLAK